jgi:hypothetical protein
VLEDMRDGKRWRHEMRCIRYDGMDGDEEFVYDTQFDSVSNSEFDFLLMNSCDCS